MLSLHTNAASLSAQTAVTKNQGSLSTSMARLSTGYRINSAMDDAAGLQIATRLKAQSSGMAVAIRNTQNATSMMQTAEGSLNEANDILVRMKDLATQAADASSNAGDKTAMQAEYDALGSELTNILGNTSFGGQKLLNGVATATQRANATATKTATGTAATAAATAATTANTAWTTAQTTYTTTPSAANATAMDTAKAAYDAAQIASNAAAARSTAAIAYETAALASTTGGKFSAALNFQIGASSSETMGLDLSGTLGQMHSAIKSTSVNFNEFGAAAGLTGTELTAVGSAATTIDKLSAAIDSVGSLRSSLGAASLMAQRFNSLNNVYNGQLQSVHQQRATIVDASNATIASIATLNQKIAQANATGASASALIDARDNAIDDLASKMALEVSDQADGTRNVSLKTGQSLVIGGVAGKLSASGGIGSAQTFSLEFASSTFGIDAAELGGQLGGLSIYERDTLLPLQQSVADIAAQLASKVNTVLTAGYTMTAAAPPAPPDGKPLFVFTASGNAHLLEVTPGFQTGDLGLSADGTPGDSTNLQNLVAIRDQAISVTTLGTVLTGDADTQLIGKLGVDSQLNQAALSTADAVRSQAVEDWQSTSGVNQDEEAVNLVEYQRMYQANMKVMSVANTLFDATLQMMG